MSEQAWVDAIVKQIESSDAFKIATKKMVRDMLVFGRSEINPFEVAENISTEMGLTKTCTKCQQWKPTQHFYQKCNKCMDCQREINREYGRNKRRAKVVSRWKEIMEKEIGKV